MTALRDGVRLAFALALAIGCAPAIARAADPPPPGASEGGRILLDQPLKAGGLILFPVVGDANSYLYVPTSPHLSLDAQGQPEFSFLRYVQNTPGKGGADADDEGEGGGILSAVVTLDVPADQIERAQRELNSQKNGAKIVGPAIYKSGTFALVSQFQDENKDLVTHLIGVGAAPVLEGAKASVSIGLTKKGAQILWESFHQKSPDIKFKFDMKLPGYWSPAKAKIVADLDRVEEHNTFKMAMATPIFEFEMNKAFDELFDSRVIKVEIIGGGESSSEKPGTFNNMVAAAEKQIRDLLFDAKGIPTTFTPAGGDKTGGGAIDKSKTLLARAQDAQKYNDDLRKAKKNAQVSGAEAERLKKVADEAEKKAADAERKYQAAKTNAAGDAGDIDALQKEVTQRTNEKTELEKAVTDLKAQLEAAKKPAGTRPDDPTALVNEANRLAEESKKDAARVRDLEQQLIEAKKTNTNADAQKKIEDDLKAAKEKAAAGETKVSDARAKAEKAKKAAADFESGAGAAKVDVAALEKKLAEAERKRDANKLLLAKAERDAAGQSKELSSGPLEDLRKAAEDAKTKASEARKAAETARQSANTASAADYGEERQEIAGYATYEMKKSHQTGHYEYSLEKYSNGELPLRFDGSIGDLRRYLDDPNYFRAANLDDPMYKQREIAVYVDGLNADNFAKFVNFVTVQMRKKHQNGDVTTDEVRIDRKNFNAEGNRFRMLYGWKGDDDRDQWLEYEWRAIWSFFGGQDVEEPWRKTIASGIRAAPPYQIRSVNLEAEPENVKEIRAITVRLFYDLGGKEQTQQVTLNPARPTDLSYPVTFMLPDGKYDYDYDVTWRLRGNRTLSAPRARTNESVLYVDEPPTAP